MTQVRGSLACTSQVSIANPKAVISVRRFNVRPHPTRVVLGSSSRRRRVLTWTGENSGGCGTLALVRDSHDIVESLTPKSWTYPGEEIEDQISKRHSFLKYCRIKRGMGRRFWPTQV